MKWRLNENSKIIVPGSETDYWYLFNGRSFEQITPTVNGGNLEFTVSKNKAVVSLIRTNFDVLDTTQLYGKIKSERILSNLKISNNINAHRVTGENLLTDGSFEEWDDTNHLTHWGESMTGSSTVNQESTDIVDGNYAVRMDVDTDNGWVSIQQTNSIEPGIYRLSFYAKVSTGGKGKVYIKDNTNNLYWDVDNERWTSTSVKKIIIATDWTQVVIIFPVNGEISLLVQFANEDLADGSFYIDNAKLEKIGVIEHYDARGGLKVVSDGTSIKKYAIDSQSSKQAELDKVWM